LWAIAFFTVALTASPPATLFLAPPAVLLVIAAVGVAAIVFSMPRIRRLRTSRSLVGARPAGHRHQATAAIMMAAGTCVRTLDEPNRSTAGDALDLVRMDDDGGWQLAPPPA
jgi:hypothetical protein